MVKKIILILILIIFSINSVFADTKDAYLEYKGYQYIFKPEDEAKFLENANKNMLLFEKTSKITGKIFYLQEAMRYYFLLSKINPDSIDAQIGLGRIYDELKLDKLAKKCFFNAYNYNNKDPGTNLYIANFYYKRNDLLNSLYYYNRSYNYGYANNYYLNCRLGALYEKLADIEQAKKYYSNALRLNPQNPELRTKSKILKELNYSNSDYYLFHK